MGSTPFWYQLYWSTDEALVDSMISRAESCGAGALVITLDTTILGWRPQDLNLGSLPFTRGHGIAQYTSDPRFNKIIHNRADAGCGSPQDPTQSGRGAHAGVHVETASRPIRQESAICRAASSG